MKSNLGRKINIRVITRAKKPEVIELEGGSLKIKLSSPPEGGRANKELIAILAKHFKIQKSKIEIVSGEKSKNKVIEIK